MNADNICDICELTPLQQGLLFHTLCAPDSGVYVTQLRALLHGPVDAAAFHRAWQAAVDRHPALRTAFLWENLDKPLQVIHRRADLAMQQFDWRRLPPDQRQSQLEMWLQVDRRRGFKLRQAPLMRIALFRFADDESWFVWSHHHVLLDGWSLPLVLKDVFRCYDVLCQGQAPALPEGRSMRQYVEWLQAQDPDAADAFWRRKLSAVASPTPLGIDRPRCEGGKSQMQVRERQRRLSRQQTASLKAAAREHRLSLNTLLQGAWALLLRRYSGEPQVVFGVTMSGRAAPIRDIESIVGLFINTLPVHMRVPPDERLLPWLQSLQAEMTELRRFEHSPLEAVQACSGVPRGTPLFESLYVLENYPLDSSLLGAAGPLQIREIHDEEQTNYPLNLVISPGDELLVRAVYDSRRLDDDAIERMLGHLETLLGRLTCNGQARLAELSCLPPEELQRVVIEPNRLTLEYPKDSCIHQMFEAQARQTPDAAAVIYCDQQISYRELDERSNQLAHFLRGLGVGPDVLVGICTRRCPEMVVGMLGVLKAGGAFLPLDPDYPRQRLAFMLEDGEAAVLLSESRLADALPEHAARLVCLDGDAEAIRGQPTTAPACPSGPKNLAYVIYTSGSTGRPKGVAIQHGGVCHMARVLCQKFDISAESRVLQFASMSFDASVAEIFPALVCGAAIVLPLAEESMPSPALVELCRRQKVTMAIFPPSVLAAMPDADLPELRTLVAAGESCSAEVARRWGRGRQFLNGYGPTEGTVCTSVGWCDSRQVRPHIGPPVPNVRAYVLDGYLQPAPIGAPGELYIGGAGLARGYLNRPGLTAERFVPDPFSSEPGARLYRTGDRCRWLPDGNLDFLGRIDHQVKVRGFRVELGEIEAVLGGHADVQQAAVVAREDAAGDLVLVAYAAPRDGKDLSVGSLRAYLQERLPHYMAPSLLLPIASLPLLPNGKIDRKALPAPDRSRPQLQQPYVAPTTREEEILAKIWCEVLGVERVGIHDEFFELGGASIKSLRIVAKASEAGLTPADGSLSPELLFEHTTIAKLAAILRLNAESPAPDHANG